MKKKHTTEAATPTETEHFTDTYRSHPEHADIVSLADAMMGLVSARLGNASAACDEAVIDALVLLESGLYRIRQYHNEIAKVD